MAAIGKSLSLCFSAIKRPQITPTATTTTTSEDHNTPSTTTVTSTSSSPQQPEYLFKSYNSLYETSKSSLSDSDSDSDMLDTTPDLTTAYASHRFFISSPGSSNSIIDSSLVPSSSSSSSSSESRPSEEVDEGVAVHTYSGDPYRDFRISMAEMVAARGIHDVRDNWKCLHELLLCYLSLNPKSTHQYIVAAFSDLLVSLLDSGAARFPAGEYSTN